MSDLSADVLVRDTNGNTLYRAEMDGVPYEEFSLVEAHVSSNGTLIVTLDVEEVSQDA